MNVIQKYDYFNSIDLQDAYFSVPLHKDFHKFVKFFWDGKLYKFVCLCFGLATGPKVFTKLLKPIFGNFRQINIRCCYYIDDSLNMNRGFDICEQNTVTMITVLESLRFTINEKKSVLVPTQRITFFGFVIDSVLFKVILTDEKVNKIIVMGRKLVNKVSVWTRTGFFHWFISQCFLCCS